MAKHAEQFRAKGVDVVAVSMSRPEALGRYLAERPLPVRFFADPDRKLYAALGLTRTTWARLLRPRVVWRYIKMIVQGARVRRVPEGEDALQLGGDFLVGSDGRVLWEYRSKDPTDRPPVEQLLALESGPGH